MRIALRARVPAPAALSRFCGAPARTQQVSPPPTKPNNHSTITIKDVRRTLEADLGLAKRALDPVKDVVVGWLDAALKVSA
jgi:hypothetical protein